jgi:hypothetical protein
MSNILFVCGFNTHPDEHNGINMYSAIELYFKFSDVNLSFFRYKTTDDLRLVYHKLAAILDTREHDLIITHSMGSCLCLKYITDTNDTRNIIMCMPFISTSNNMKCATHIPMIQYLYVPKCCMIPNYTLYDGGNILNDDITMVRCQQVYFAITDIFLNEDELVRVINDHPNLRIIYAENEMVSPIDGSILSKIRGKIAFSKGKHVSFANIVYMGDFFDVLTTQIKKLI